MLGSSFGISNDIFVPIAALWYACMATLPVLFLELRYRKSMPRRPEIGETSFFNVMTFLGSIWTFTAIATAVAVIYT